MSKINKYIKGGMRKGASRQLGICSHQCSQNNRYNEIPMKGSIDHIIQFFLK